MSGRRGYKGTILWKTLYSAPFIPVPRLSFSNRYFFNIAAFTEIIHLLSPQTLTDSQLSQKVRYTTEWRVERHFAQRIFYGQ